MPLSPAPNAGERRKLVTVVFADVVGSTALGERVDPETLRWAMQRWFRRMAEAIERHGGTVENFIGDAVMAVFGSRPPRRLHRRRRATSPPAPPGRSSRYKEELVHRTRAVERVEIEARRPEVDERIRIVVALQLRRRVERDVMIDELREVRVAGGDGRVEAARALAQRCHQRVDRARLRLRSR
jgi:Adenylate and Guanylate cyclase catalytic domain